MIIRGEIRVATIEVDGGSSIEVAIDGESGEMFWTITIDRGEGPEAFRLPTTRDVLTSLAAGVEAGVELSDALECVQRYGTLGTVEIEQPDPWAVDGPAVPAANGYGWPAVVGPIEAEWRNELSEAEQPDGASSPAEIRAAFSMCEEARQRAAEPVDEPWQHRPRRGRPTEVRSDLKDVVRYLGVRRVDGTR